MTEIYIKLDKDNRQIDIAYDNVHDYSFNLQHFIVVALKRITTKRDVSVVDILQTITTIANNTDEKEALIDSIKVLDLRYSSKDEILHVEGDTTDILKVFAYLIIEIPDFIEQLGKEKGIETIIGPLLLMYTSES